MTDLPSHPPAWAQWFTDLGASISQLPSVPTGEWADRVVISVPTGQFATWLIISGALNIDPPPLPTPVAGVRYSTWSPATQRMDDCVFSEYRDPDILEVDGHPGKRVMRQSLPVREVPEGTPTARSGIAPRASLRDELRNLPGRRLDFTQWYARRCLSPVVIIGDGREYLRKQREELIEKAPFWLSDTARVLLNEDSQQVSNPSRMYFHPFMVFSASVGNDLSWLRAMKPRLVIVTSWSSYTRRHQALFAGSPHIVLTNRRVASALDAADFLSHSGINNGLYSEINTPPRGIFVKSFQQQVLLDSGDVALEDDLEIEL